METQETIKDSLVSGDTTSSQHSPSSSNIYYFYELRLAAFPTSEIVYLIEREKKDLFRIPWRSMSCAAGVCSDKIGWSSSAHSLYMISFSARNIELYRWNRLSWILKDQLIGSWSCSDDHKLNSFTPRRILWYNHNYR